MNLSTLVRTALPAAIAVRHDLHRIPELSYEEVKTARRIREELRRLGIECVAGVPGAETATIAWIGDASRPCVALRADIDALPIAEATGLPYASTHEGRMHACGHDGHAAGLLGAAAVLRQIADRLPVCVKLIFQPAEEGGAGGQRLVQAGVLDGRVGPAARAIFGLHGWPGMPVGMVSTRPGPLLAATDTFCVDFVGRGCHGAAPHLGRDPIVAACEAVVNLQQVVSRDLDPTESALITVGVLRAGTATNIIPDRARIEGTARTLSPETRRLVRACVERRCRGIAEAGGCAAEIEWRDGYPVTCNDPAMADLVARAARDALGAERYLPAARPYMGGEDFSYYLEQTPGCFFLVGVNPDPSGVYPPLHSDRYDFTDAALETGMRMFCELATRWS